MKPPPAPHVAAAIARGQGGAAQAKPADPGSPKPGTAPHVAAAVAAGRGEQGAAQRQVSPARSLAPHVARALSPAAAGQVILRMEEQKKDKDSVLGKRERKLNPNVTSIIDISGEKRRSRGKSVLEKAMERKEKTESSKKVEKKEKRLSRYEKIEKKQKVGGKELDLGSTSPPLGVFLMFGLRKEVPWAVTEDTGSLTGYQLALSKGTAKKDDEGTDIYQCPKCSGYWPTKSDRKKSSKGYAYYITVDHSPPFSQRLEEGLYDVVACDGERHWKGVGRDEAIRGFNNPKHLKLLCNGCNSSKGGLTDYGRTVPNDFEECPGQKKCKIYGQKGHKALASDYEFGNL